MAKRARRSSTRRRAPAALAARPAAARESRPRQDAFWFAGALVALLLPYLWLRAGTPEPGSLYTWITPPYPEDGLAYLAWVRQAAEGALLFHVKYTQLPHQAILFQPLFLVAGWLAALTGLAAGPALFVLHVAAAVVFLIELRRFTGLFGLSSFERSAALWLLLASSGLGFWLGGEGARSADLFMPELNTLWSLVWNPVFVVGTTLMLAVFRLVITSTGRDRDRAFAVAGLLTGLLAFVHSYDVVIVACVVAGVVIQRDRRASLRPLACFAASAAPACLLQATISLVHPVLSIHGAAGRMVSPSPLAYAAGLGLPALLALYGVSRAGRERRLGALAPLCIWIAAAALLAYLPVWFQRKLVMGVHVPVCLLASIGLADLARRASTGRPLLRGAIVAAVVLATTPTHFSNALRMRREVESDASAFYVAPAVADALRFLDATPSEAVVLAHPFTARVIPGLAGNTVTLGHWAQSVDSETHVRWLRPLFDPRSGLSEAERQRALRDSRIEYLFVDEAMRRHWLGGRDLPAWLAAAGEELYDRGGVVILRVKRPSG